jgi:type IV pilus assembly protein PilC
VRSEHPSTPLSHEETRLLAEQLYVLAGAGLPLASGLRAAAEEMSSQRLAAATSAIADRLEQGRPLDDALRDDARLMPEHMLRLIEAGLRAGNLPAALSQLVEIDRTSVDIRRSILMAIAYPVFLAVLCTTLLVLLGIQVIPDLRRVAHDFDTGAPFSTHLLFSLSEPHMLRYIGVIVAATTMLLLGMRISLPPERWRWALTKIPLLGPLLLWRGVAEWARLVSLFLKQNLPAPEALRLAATGVNDAIMAVEGLRLARTTTHGRGIADSLSMTGKLPETIEPIVRWGEQRGALPAAFDTVAEMFENRIRLRTALLRSILPPVAFICVAIGVLWLINAMFGPLIAVVFPPYFGLRGKGRRAYAPNDLGETATTILGAIIALVALLVLLRLFAGVFHGSIEKLPLVRMLSRMLRNGWRIAFFIALFLALWKLTLLELAILMWACTLVVALLVAFERKRSENREFLWLLGTAIDKGIPLAAAARAYADEHNHRLGRKARRFARCLEQGCSIDETLAAARIAVPNDALVALRTVTVTHSATPLVKSFGCHATVDATIQSAVSKLLYSSLLAMFTAATIAFLTIRILPAYVKICRDFALPLSEPTRIFFGLAKAMYPIGIGILLFVAVLVAVTFLFRLIGVSSRSPLLPQMFALPLDRSTVLRSLANAVEHRTPVALMVDALAKQYPKRYIRTRLSDSAGRIASGANWCESLRASGLLSIAEAGLLKAAERCGSLGWALNELADRLVRKFVARANQILTIGFPVVLLLYGALTFFIGLALLDPLKEIITDLLRKSY